MSRFARALLLPAVIATTPVLAGDMPSLRGPIAPSETASAGFYLGGRGAYVLAPTTSWSTGAVALAPSVTLNGVIRNRYENAIGYSGFVGYDFGAFVPGANARIEFEIGRYALDVTTHHFSGTQTTALGTTTLIQDFTRPAAGGSTSALFTLANYYIDFDLGRVRPFVGVGIGAAMVDFSGHTISNVVFLDDSRWSLAYQIGAGLSFDLLPNLSLEAGYRYLGVTNVQVDSRGRQRSHISLDTQQFTFGARVKF